MREAKKDRPSIFRVFTTYKNKAKKVRPVDSDDLNGDVPGRLEDWKVRVIKEEQERGKDRLIGKYNN